MSEKKHYETLIMQGRGYSLKLEIDGSLAELYRGNPGRVERIIKAHFANARADILLGEELDSITSNVRFNADMEIIRIIEGLKKQNKVNLH